jgi:hypothetical protein
MPARYPILKKPISSKVLTWQDFSQTKWWDVLMTSISERGGRTMGQFCVGDVVTCIPHLIPRTAAPGDYKIVAAMPDRKRRSGVQDQKPSRRPRARRRRKSACQISRLFAVRSSTGTPFRPSSAAVRNHRSAVRLGLGSCPQCIGFGKPAPKFGKSQT